jgi:predicted GIY-YIG superfamily endonuclease
MTDDEMGYHEEPKNGSGIIRAKTTGKIYSWELPRSTRALENFNSEIQKIEFPGIYLLFDDAKNRVYVGEAKDVYNRLKTHNNIPEEKIEKWNKVIIINDGRAAGQSEFNDTVIRKTLEHYLIRLIKANKYNVVAQGEAQILNQTQRVLVEKLEKELDFFLFKKSIITKLIEEKGQEEIFPDDLKQILQRSGRTIQRWGSKEATIDNHKVFIRPASKKTKGWQITFRDIFKNCLENCDGYLLVPRDGVLLIPFSEVKKVVTDATAFKQNTIDVYINFGEDKTTLTYKENVIDVTQYKLL